MADRPDVIPDRVHSVGATNNYSYGARGRRRIGSQYRDRLDSLYATYSSTLIDNRGEARFLSSFETNVTVSLLSFEGGPSTPRA